MAKKWSEKITSFFLSDKSSNYDIVNEIDISNTNINKYKESILNIVVILGTGLLLSKIIHSIVFLIFNMIFITLIKMTSKGKYKIEYIKQSFVFLITVLGTEVIDIDFYKNLILFYTGISIIGINVLVPIYNKKILINDILKNKRSILLKAISAITFLFVVMVSNMPNLTEYILYMTNPILIIYINLIISIIKENIIMD